MIQVDNSLCRAVLFVLQIGSVFCLCFLSHVQAACLTQAQLKKLSGSYVAQALWNEVDVNKNWSLVTAKDTPTNTYPALWIEKDGGSMLVLSWHEGEENVCIEKKGKFLTAKPIESRTTLPIQYLRISEYERREPQKSLMNRIFGKNCFRDTENKRWCFDRGSVSVDGKEYSAELVVDRSEMPDYGTPLKISGQKKFWIFVPHAAGWKVFLDVWASDSSRKPINTDIDRPWQILKRLP